MPRAPWHRSSRSCRKRVIPVTEMLTDKTPPAVRPKGELRMFSLSLSISLSHDLSGNDLSVIFYAYIRPIAQGVSEVVRPALNPT
jgi:hypothetical protein